ncbi:triple gene block protein 3 [Rubus virus 1]|uniref:Movement protein TGBp3 n=1 Tax=Rubus virus 1 TaxID=2754817 RepID=A0A7D5YNL8_9VIRU|nr:triple gene block protein 3 [Rubus virus 1]QLI58028.1 triple gene block protein 3 [Rubus virus 1]QLI58075.1 triple gene block protein 3 [Rubus virus 1]QLI58077.1 triple gene block protein 3 [Rubus virus 1]QLI58079.1 triple gene block protein 3 [Rubus virus 1]QLI58081.1 triple gene block protein 3 [Rubus virus 1]
MQYKDLVVAILSFAAVVLVLHVLQGSGVRDECSIVITGESVVVKGCVWNKDFIDLVKGLKPFYHPLG